MARLLVVFGLFACASCGSVPSPSQAQSATPAAASAAEYRLGPGDKLRILVFNRTELSGEFTLSNQGRISYPLVGEIDAAGLTLPEFSTRLSDSLRDGIVREPNVSVEIAAYRPFYILGEVANPGTYPYSPGLTVINAVATAGGFSYRANRGRVYIQRAGEGDERRYELTSTMHVQPGDTIRIPERLF